MPITRHLQFSLFLNATLGHLVATAPLGPNANHRQTAFGGSLSMLATVAGWAMTRLVLRAGQSNAEVVIQKSKIDYCAPVCDTLAFTCTPPSRRERDSFFEALDRWGRARLPLCCRATKDDGTGRAVTFEGSYVAISGQ